MKQLKSVVLLAAMLLPMLAHAEDKVVTTPPIRVQVQVDAQGHLSAVTPMLKLDEPYAGLVQRTLANWSFYPARVEGKPVNTTTWLTIELKAQPRGNGDFDVQVVYLGNGPYIESKGFQFPQYPSSMLRVRREAKIVVLATVGADGGLSEMQVEQALTTDGMPAGDFVDSVRDAMKKVKVRPIIVNGEPVASRITYPATFSIGGHDTFTHLERAKDSAKFISVEPAVAEKAAAPGDVMVALDSPVSPRSLPGS